MKMKFVKLAFIALFIAWHYKPVYGALFSGKSGAATEVGKNTLDISKTKSTDELEYSKNKDFKIFTAKGEHTFNKIVKKTLDIWTATGDDHAVRVVRKGKGSGKKHLGILLKNGKFVLLSKEGKNKPWNDITSNMRDVTRLKFFGDGDKELTTSDYKINIVGCNKTFAYTYEFTSAGNCKKIKNGNTEIWKSTNDAAYKDIKKFSLGLLSNSFYVYNSANEYKKLEIA